MSAPPWHPQTFIPMTQDPTVTRNLKDFPNPAEQLHDDERAYKPLKGFFFPSFWAHKMKSFIHIHTPVGSVSLIRDATNETLTPALD